MPLTLYLRGNVYWVKGTVRGEFVRETTRITKEHEDEAEAYRVERESQIIKRSVYGPEATVTFREAAITYCETARPKGTQRNMILGRGLKDGSTSWNLIDAIGKKKLKDVNQELIDRLARDRLPNASPATIQRQLIAPINAIMERAAKRGWCARPNFERPKQTEGRIRWLTPDEAQKILDCSQPYIKPLLLFLLGTGARLSEALELDWRDVDLGDSYCHFWNTKNGSRRKAQFPPSCVAALASLPKREGKVFLTEAGEAYPDFGRESGGQIRYPFHDARTKAGVDHITPHGLRHTWASWFYCRSKDLLLLRTEGGWKSSSQVERYAHLVPSRYTDGIARIWGGEHPAIEAKSGTDDEKEQGKNIV